MQGRDVAMAIRHAKPTRNVPIVFVGGDSEKVALIKHQLPDAIYTEWGRVKSALKQAIHSPPEITTVPSSAMEGYSGTPLPKKLGIKPDSVLALINGPSEFPDHLGKLPAGVTIKRIATGQPDLSLWFVRSKSELEKMVASMTHLGKGGGLWIIWPKKRSAVTSDLTQAIVRKIAMDAGLVDFKIAAIDSNWSGLRFTLRRASGISTR
jgi:hypothetical protein